MKRSFLLAAIALLLFAAHLPLAGQGAVPKMSTVTPDSGKVGDLITVEGENLSKANVAELYLTDGKNDFKVEVVEQGDKAIKFKVPEKVKQGRLSLMVLTTGKEPKLIEQPVKMTVE